jgi:membrane associated rhomboid family serine protease
MVSWLHKGRTLEPRLGTERLLGLVLFFGIASNVLYVGKLAAQVPNDVNLNCMLL